ncbi:MAG: NAD(P)H-binding protein [Deltaproteobacteria bacterium]|nr:NAD(P)H-binding protein [Deltaproteobacteria bacterium]
MEAGEDGGAVAPSTRPTRVLVVGAHHGVGALVVERARQRSWSVTPFEGDALDAAAVSRAVEGQDAIISTLGPRKDSAGDLCSRGTENIIAAMKAHGVRRIVQVTGAMIGHPKDRLGLVYRAIAAAVPEAALNDRRLQERIVVESGLDRTLVRPTRLTDEPPRGVFRDGERERIGAFARISRADVAEALVRAVVRPDAVGRAWTLQY